MNYKMDNPYRQKSESVGRRKQVTYQDQVRHSYTPEVEHREMPKPVYMKQDSFSKFEHR